MTCQWPSNVEVMNQITTSSLIGSLEGIVVIIPNLLDKIQRTVCSNLENKNNFEMHDKHAMFVQCWEQEKWACVDTVETTLSIFCQLSIVLILTGVMYDFQRSQLKKKKACHSSCTAQNNNQDKNRRQRKAEMKGETTRAGLACDKGKEVKEHLQIHELY